MLEIKEITCIRGERTLFTGLSFLVQAGEVVQISGPNGVGKTSLLQLLTGSSQPNDGQIYWQKTILKKAREQWHRELIWLGHLTGIKSGLSADENLKFYHPDASQHARWDALAQVDLVGFEEVLVSQLSAGQQRRVALARLWLTKASFWILDEPFTALDVMGVKNLTMHIEQHVERGGAVILTTHQPLRPLTVPLRSVILTEYEERS